MGLGIVAEQMSDLFRYALEINSGKNVTVLKTYEIRVGSV